MLEEVFHQARRAVGQPRVHQKGLVGGQEHVVAGRPDDLREDLPSDFGRIGYGHPSAFVIKLPEAMIGFRCKDLALLEYRFDGFAVNLIRIGGSDFSLGQLLRRIEHHVAHIDIVIGITAFPQNRFSDIENLIQLKFDISFINPQTSHRNILLPLLIRSRERSCDLQVITSRSLQSYNVTGDLNVN